MDDELKAYLDDALKDLIGKINVGNERFLTA